MSKAIIFDSEGVIINTETIWDLAQSELLSKRGKLYKADEIKSNLTGKSDFDGIKWIKSFYELKDDLDSLRKERMKLFKSHLLKRINFIEGFESFFKTHCKNYKVAVATAMNRELLDEVIIKLKLDDYFEDKIFSIDSVGKLSKPDPSIFLYAAEKINTNPKNCVVVEDSPSGIIGARNAGMTSIGLATTFSVNFLIEEANPDYVFDSYESFGSNFEKIMKTH